MKQALYVVLQDMTTKKVKCFLCPHTCNIMPGKTGICRARKNIDGILYSLTYNKFTSINMDPIEKKPLYHFYPGKGILSVGTIGCNFRCSFCQNWEISQADFDDSSLTELSPDAAVVLAQKYKSIGIAYTYNEPLINFEWILDTSKLARKKSLKNVLVTNGYINQEPLEELLPYIDAANIDVKFFNDESYEKMCGGHLEPVLKTVETCLKKNVHIELTNLIIPGENDSKEEIENLVKWIASLNNKIPLHFSRYFPQYKLDTPPTEKKTLVEAYEIAKKHLKYVYIGNVNDFNYSNTLCDKCGGVLIERQGYATHFKNFDKGKCNKCGQEAKIIS
ncbi:MAG: AmmeMemoRadiSam system radical SAM enzyme [Elusimicrobia bacterium]|nr:AmmeMemoRadiSam system radical SAM enzyme [Elusimicrobiota bacterium]